jgi:hypothetical protein
MSLDLIYPFTFSGLYAQPRALAVPDRGQALEVDRLQSDRVASVARSGSIAMVILYRRWRSKAKSFCETLVAQFTVARINCRYSVLGVSMQL